MIATNDDPVNHPAHYTRHCSGLECIDVVEHLTFNIGNAFKYVWRCSLKGNEVEDLKKALWYLKRELRMQDVTRISGSIISEHEALFFTLRQKVVDADPECLIGRALASESIEDCIVVVEEAIQERSR